MVVTSYSIKDLLTSSDLDKLDTKLLLCHILKISNVKLITHDDYILTRSELESFNHLRIARKNGMPMNYILGFREFYSREFKVSADTLIPRPETELIIDTLISLVKIPHQRLLDLGTGSGCIAITAKLEVPDLIVEAVDKFIPTLDIARENAKSLGANINFFQSDWFSNVSGKFDIIVSNPPYIHSKDKHLQDLKYEPIAALTDFMDGLSHLKKIISEAKVFLNKSGWLILEHGFDQAKAIHALMDLAEFKQVRTIKDYSGNDRITIATFT